MLTQLIYNGLTLVLATSIVLVAFLLAVTSDLMRTKGRPSSPPALPIVPNKASLNSTEELQSQLELLKSTLDQKQAALEKSRKKVLTVTDSLNQLNITSDEIRNYYKSLKEEIVSSEKECRDLQNQIEAYTRRRNRLREEVRENVRYYTELLNTMSLKEATEKSIALPGGA